MAPEGSDQEIATRPDFRRLKPKYLEVTPQDLQMIKSGFFNFYLGLVPGMVGATILVIMERRKMPISKTRFSLSLIGLNLTALHLVGVIQGLKIFNTAVHARHSSPMVDFCRTITGYPCSLDTANKFFKSLEDNADTSKKFILLDEKCRIRFPLAAQESFLECFIRTPDDWKLIEKCRREAFYYHSLPLMLGTTGVSLFTCSYLGKMSLSAFLMILYWSNVFGYFAGRKWYHPKFLNRIANASHESPYVQLVRKKIEKQK